jgi:uncharacterized protein (DUF1501 family)
MMNPKDISRRKFLGQASCAGLGYLTFANSLLNLKAINSAAIANAAVSDFNDYKAIVCILLAGGNDSFNMLMPYDNPSHAEYVTARSGLYTNGGLAIPQSDLSNTILSYTANGKNWAVHPSMTRVHELFNNGRLAFLANTGTLVQPTTKSQYQNDQGLPLGLFSHSDQIQQWQTGIPDERGAKGWAGKMADLIGDCNGNQNISMNISMSGSNIWQTGDHTIEYALDPYQGAVGIDGYDPTPDYLEETVRTAAIDSLLGQYYQDIFKKTFNNVVKDARDGFIEFDAALQNAITFPADVFPDSYLGASLEMITRTIDIRDTLDFKRQVFFITVGGWDHHDEVINNQLGMLGMVSDALGRFQDALGTSFNYIDGNGQTQNHQGINVENDVLTMMISEFGRTLTSNGNGSDHAWGGNTLVMGGPNLMNGGTIFGSYPSLDLGSNNAIELGLGRFIPTLSTDEYFAEVAKWFGVPSTDLGILFPNLGNFYDPNSSSLPIGFLNL